MPASLKVTHARPSDSDLEKSVIVALPRAIKLEPVSSSSWRFSFAVDSEVPGVEAHFPQMRLIAGYMQLLWVSEALSRISTQLQVSRIVDIKFSGQIPVPSQVTLECELSEDSSTLKFSIFDQDGIKTKGRVAVLPRGEVFVETPVTNGQNVC